MPHNVASELEVASFIGLWLEIHGGDPPQTSADVAAVVGQIIASLSTSVFGERSEVSADTIKSRLAAINVQVKQATQASAGASRVTADARIVQGATYNEIIWPGAYPGQEIIVKVPHFTKT